MKKVEMTLSEGILEKVNELSDILGFKNPFKIINASLVSSFYKYWMPYQRILSEFPEWDFSSGKVDDKILNFCNTLREQVDSDFEKVKALAKYEKEFENTHPLASFKDSKECFKEFLNYLDSKPEQEMELVEEILEEPIDESITQEETVVIRTKVKEKLEEVPISSKPSHEFQDYMYFFMKFGSYAISSIVLVILTFTLFSIIWYPAFDLERFILYEPLVIPFLFGPIIFLIFLSTWGIYYFIFPSLEEWRDKRHFKAFEKEFRRQNPYGTFKNPTERLQAFTGYIQSKNKS